jgi:hypothetical protein
MHIGYWWESWTERYHEEDVDVGWRIKLNLIIEIGWGAMYWINLAQDKDHCRALVNTVMNLRVP